MTKQRRGAPSVGRWAFSSRYVRSVYLLVACISGVRVYERLSGASYYQRSEGMGWPATIARIRLSHSSKAFRFSGSFSL